jgi:hypothetical protein
MTDSADRKPEENTQEAIGKRLDKYKRKEPKEMTEFSQLPTWVRTAITMHDVLGLSWKAAAERCGKSGATLNHYKKSIAVKQWREELAEIVQDPKTLAEMVLNANSLNVTLEYFAAYDKAAQAGDYAAVGKMSQDLLDRQGITKKKETVSAENLSITLNIGSGSLDVPEVTSDFEVVDVDYEVESE